MKTKITLSQVIENGHSANEALAVLALCSHLECDLPEISAVGYDHYGLSVYRHGKAEYAIGDEDEAQEAAEQNIADSVWAFNASFILSECGLPSELEEAITAFQKDKCEGANDALVALVEKCCVNQSLEHGLKAFADAAISADGRGHFLSGYDGDEIEESVEDSDGERAKFFIYRIN